MKSRPPDRLTLAAMAAGEQDLAAWRDLVGAPGGAEAWAAAVARRERLERLALLALDHAFLRAVLPVLLSMRRRRQPWPTVTLRACVEDTQLLAATLGAADDGETIVPIRWGDTQVVRLPIGRTVWIDPQPATEEVRVCALTADGEHELPRRGWRLESGEAPVLLLAYIGADSPAAALAGQGSVAAVVVEERAEGAQDDPETVG